MQKSLKQIIYETSVLVDAHVQLRSFHYGDLLDIIKKGRIDYTSCFLSINNAVNNPFFETITLELFVFDILAEDDSNRTDIENTTKRILNDLITTIRYSNRWNNFSEVLSDVTELKYYDNLQDRLSGWGGTIQLKIYSKDCLVGLPIDGYDFDQAGDFEATVNAIVRNSIGDTLATKVVSDDDNIITVPNISFTDSDGTVTSEPSGVDLVCTPVTPATVENSNESYSTTVASGGTLVLPDITVTDSDGSTFTQPSVTDVVCTPPPPCADAIVNINSVFWDNVPSGATENIIVLQSSGSTEVGAIQGDHFRIGDSTAVVKNSVNTVISTTSIKAEDTEDINLPDITVTDSDGSTFTQPSVTNVTCTPQVKELTIAIPYEASDDTSTVTIIANAVGTITAANTTGLTSVVFTVNAGTVTLPFALALSDVLEITYDAAASGGTIILTGNYV